MNVAPGRPPRPMLLLWAVVAAAVLLPSVAAAHGEAIDVHPKQARPGEEITVSGTGWKGKVGITLEGIRGVVPLGSPTADDEKAFTFAFAVPRDVPAGSYRIVARQGDESVEVDFSVLAPVAASAPDGAAAMATQPMPVPDQPQVPGEGMTMPGQPVAVADQPTSGSRATLVAERDGAETIAIGVVVAALIGAGALLVLRGTEGRLRTQE